MKRIAVTACAALGTAGVLSAVLAPVHAREAKSRWDERDLVVTLTTPTTNQEVLPDLTDQGINGVLTVHFSSPLNVKDIIDGQNTVNQLSAKVEALNSSFERLPGTPTVHRNKFVFSPLSTAVPQLAQGQYTFNFKSSIRNQRGRLLNNGQYDYSTTFSVGTDVFPPVLRKISPIDGQLAIPLQQEIVATFNEPIDLTSAVANVAVFDASTSPVTQIPGKGSGGTGVSVRRGGFDVVFTPDPCFGYPPKTTIQFVVQATAAGLNKAALLDLFQNKFQRDPGLQWSADPILSRVYHSPNGTFDDNVGTFTMRFTTVGVKPQPAGLRTGGPQMAFTPFIPPLFGCTIQIYASPGCYQSGNVIHYTTNQGIGELDLRAFLARWNQGITDFSLVSVLPNTPARLGRPAGITFDPRVIGYGPGGTVLPSSFHTFIYVVDERTATVQVVRSDNLSVMGRFTGFSSPRDVSVTTDFSQVRSSLYVSDYASNQVVGIDLEGIKVSFTGQPGAQSPCDVIKDNQSRRIFVTTGRGPTEVAADGYLYQRVLVVNTLDHSISMVDPQRGTVIQTYDVGSNPVSADWMTFGFGTFRFAMIANQGGLEDPNGSASFYVNTPPLNNVYFNGINTVRDGIENTFTDGVKNPTHVFATTKHLSPNGNPVPAYILLSNTGGKNVMTFTLGQQGTLFGLNLVPQLLFAADVGPNPTSAVMDPYWPMIYNFATVVGTGSMAIWDPTRSNPPISVSAPGARKAYTCFTN